MKITESLIPIENNGLFMTISATRVRVAASKLLSGARARVQRR